MPPVQQRVPCRVPEATVATVAAQPAVPMLDVIREAQRLAPVALPLPGNYQEVSIVALDRGIRVSVMTEPVGPPGRVGELVDSVSSQPGLL